MLPQLLIVFVTLLYLLLNAIAASLTVCLAVALPVRIASHPKQSWIMKPKSCVSVRSLFARSGACHVRASDRSSADDTFRVLLRER